MKMRWRTFNKKYLDKKFWAAAFTLAGTMIGAGILGLPYVFSKSGFLIGLGWLLFLGGILIFVQLCLGEVILRTKGEHQLAGLAEKYLGKWGKNIMFFAMIFGVYSALLAYLIGEGQSFSRLFTGGLDYALYFGIGFWVIMTLLLREGLKGLKKVETWGVLVIIFIILLMLGWYFPQIEMSNVSYTDFSFVFLPFGIVLFALLGFSALPELKREIRGSEKNMKKAIIIGSLISIILYIIFSFVFVGVLGKNVTEVATLSFGNFITVLGVFTMLTSYFVLSFALKDMFDFDFNISKISNFLFVSIFPLILYIFISVFGLLSFVKILGLGGVVGGGLAGILILLMNKKAKKQGNRKPEYKIPLPWIIVGILCLLFLIGIFFEFFFGLVISNI